MIEHRFVPSYAPSPSGECRFSQPKRGLGESGLVELLPLVFFRRDDDVASFDEYELLPCEESWDCWNKDGTRCFFMARRYPQGTFPCTEDDLDRMKGEAVIVAVDVRDFSVLSETPVFAFPEDVRWNPTGEWVVIQRDDLGERAARGIAADEEFESAAAYMNAPGTVGEDSPINDPTRLEHYLFYYDPRYCGPDPQAYATRMRDAYLKSLSKD